MRKRIFAGIFWFLAVGYFFEFAGAMYGLPPALGSVAALGVALFMGIDPLGVLWEPRWTRRVAQVPEPRGDGETLKLPR